MERGKLGLEFVTTFTGMFDLPPAEIEKLYNDPEWICIGLDYRLPEEAEVVNKYFKSRGLPIVLKNEDLANNAGFVLAIQKCIGLNVLITLISDSNSDGSYNFVVHKKFCVAA